MFVVVVCIFLVAVVVILSVVVAIFLFHVSGTITTTVVGRATRAVVLIRAFFIFLFCLSRLGHF